MSACEPVLDHNSSMLNHSLHALFRGRSDVSLHCQVNGDYEPLQCDDGRCWCADETTGEPYSTAVLEQFYQLLPCYEDASVTGSQYLRRCESRSVARAKIRRTLSYHGLTWPMDAYEDIDCDPDGSFGSYKCIQTQETCFCTDKYCNASEAIKY